jgi:hypothetical protein
MVWYCVGKGKEMNFICDYFAFCTFSTVPISFWGLRNEHNIPWRRSFGLGHFASLYFGRVNV